MEACLKLNIKSKKYYIRKFVMVMSFKEKKNNRVLVKQLSRRPNRFLRLFKIIFVRRKYYDKINYLTLGSQIAMVCRLTIPINLK